MGQREITGTQAQRTAGLIYHVMWSAETGIHCQSIQRTFTI
jgi:hypothetical protein